MWGVGGVGTHIVQLAHLVGAVPILAFDINPVVRERALELGADYAFDSRDPDLKKKVAEATGGRMLDVAFDAAGLAVTFSQALDCLAVGGRLIQVGLSDQEGRPWARPPASRCRRSRSRGTSAISPPTSRPSPS